MRSTIAAQFNEVRDRRDNLVAEALLAIQRNDRAELEQLAGAGGPLEQALTAVENLPPLDDALAHGYTLDGVKYPACPRVN